MTRTIAAVLFLLVGLTMATASDPRINLNPRPHPGMIPPRSECWTEKGHSWERNPMRKTLFWNGMAGLLYCDDPDCNNCRFYVYEDNEDDPPAGEPGPFEWWLWPAYRGW